MVNYGDFQAISDVSLDMKEGEIVALLGSNGAGKSTIYMYLSDHFSSLPKAVTKFGYGRQQP